MQRDAERYHLQKRPQRSSCGIDLEQPERAHQRRQIGTLLEDSDACDSGSTCCGTKRSALHIYASQGKDRKPSAALAGFHSQIGTLVVLRGEA